MSMGCPPERQRSWRGPHVANVFSDPISPSVDTTALALRRARWSVTESPQTPATHLSGAFAMLLPRMPRARWLAIGLLLATASCGPETALSSAAGTSWPEADRLFHQDPLWLGADGAYSIDL